MNIEEIYENNNNENLDINNNKNNDNDKYYDMNYISSADKDEKDKIISLFHNLNINDLNENEIEGDSDWFKEPLKKRICRRTDNTDIMKNEKLNKIIKKRKTIYPKENSSDKEPYKKMILQRNSKKLDG